MDRPKLTVKDLRNRYRRGERNFTNANLTGESLCGLNLRGINLREANLSYTDLRGANLTEAILVGANLVGAKTGTQRRWMLPKLLMTWVSIAFPSYLLALYWAYFAVQLIAPNGTTSLTKTVSGDIITGIFGLGIFTVFLLLTYWRGILATVGVGIAAFAFAITFAVTFTVPGNTRSLAIVFGSVFAVAVAVFVAVAVAVAVSGAITIAVAVVVAAVISGGITVNVSSAVSSPASIAVAVSISVAGTTATLIVAYLLSCRALKGYPRDQVIRNVAVWFASWGGTQFKGADLTEADCSKSTLKYAHLYGANLTLTRFHLAQQVNLARLGTTILSDFAVQNLLTKLQGQGKSYRGKNLKGANLKGANLSDADFTEADLSQATLEGAEMQRVNLTKTQALGTQFWQSNLTGACLESWNIDSTTKLDGAICEHVYLLNNQQERRPNSGTFQPGEFTKLFAEVLDTIDLIFQNGIDWKAFLQTFRQVQVEHERAELAIQSIENKGDGVGVVKLHTAPDADKAAIHESFMSGYKTALKEAEERYKAQLYAKDDQIQYHRQQNANMQEVVKLLAARPINIDVKATAESKAMQGNDQSQKFNVQGDFTINAQNSVVSLRDISGQVSNQISQLSTDSMSDQPSLKDLLTQLQQAVEADTELDDGEKAEALAEVGELASAAQNPKESTMQKMAKGAMNALKGIAASLSDASKLVSACKELMPLIMAAFGLP